MTTKQELLDTISGLVIVDPESITVNGYPWNGFSGIVRFSLHTDQLQPDSVRVLLLDDVVAMISFEDNSNITIGEIINALGDPEFVLVSYDSHGRKVVTLFNVSRGISIFYEIDELPPWQRSEISPDIRFYAIDYFAPDILPILLDKEIYTTGSLNGQEIMERMVPWIGYGSIEENYEK